MRQRSDVFVRGYGLPDDWQEGVHYVAILPAARKCGLGAAMTLAALQDRRSLGYQSGALQASDQGFPFYQRMGLVEVCKIDLFVGRAPR